MLELEDALSRILAAVPPTAAESVALPDLHGRFLTETVTSPIALPIFDNSAMDGYAVRATDVAGATLTQPVSLRLVGRVAAGETFNGEVVAGTCVRLFTGSPLPRGSDSVVMQEDTRISDGSKHEVLVLDSVKPGENARFSGEDVKAGGTLVESGGRITTGQLCLLAAAGVTRAKVGRRPVVGLLATGSELREPGETLGPGRIYESNRLGLATLVRAAGALPIIFPLVADELMLTRKALETAFEQCDAVVTSGGVSVGEMDFVKQAFEQAGGRLDFWKVSIRPGKPFVLGRLAEKLLFGLPGNPVSALVTFLVLVRPALLRWQGAADVSLPAHPAVLAEPLANRGNRRHFIRVKTDAQGRVHSAGAQASHVLSSLGASDGLVDLPAQASLERGTTVPVLRWE